LPPDLAGGTRKLQMVGFSRIEGKINFLRL
jgi:hypothetical protein